MTRNLINAQAWKKGRDKVCKVCKWFAEHALGNHDYEWEKCIKKSDAEANSNKWQGGKCRDFEPREKQEKQQ